MKPWRKTLIGRRVAVSSGSDRYEAENGLPRDSVSAGDLELPRELSPEQLGLTLLQMEIGPVTLALRGFGIGKYSRETSVETFAYTLSVFLDKLGWQPLSTDFDYGASVRRMWREVFPDLLEMVDKPLR